MSPIVITRAGVIGTLVALLVAAGCIRLGVWQLDRLEERRARNEIVRERMAAPPLVLDEPVEDADGVRYRRAAVEGEWDHARSIVLAGRSHRGTPGVYVFTPIRLGGGGAVLVNRGWLPSPDGATVDLAQVPAAGPARLETLLIDLPDTEAEPPASEFKRVWYRFDADALQRQFPYEIGSAYAQALPAPGAAERPIRLDPPTLHEGRHLSYAIQWFSFAAIALIGWAALALRGRPADPTRD